MEKFPDHIDAPLMASNAVPPPGSVPDANGSTIQHAPPGRWLSVPRKENGSARWGSPNGSAGRHSRQKSLTDAFRTIRSRNGSISQNAHELAGALRVPLSPKLVVSLTSLPSPPESSELCLQYLSQALGSHCS